MEQVAKIIDQSVMPISRIQKRGSDPQVGNDAENKADTKERVREMRLEYTKEELDKAVENINGLIAKNAETHFEFKIHEKTGYLMAKLIDTETKEVIKEIPAEKILDLVANIWEMVGIIVDERG